VQEFNTLYASFNIKGSRKFPAPRSSRCRGSITPPRSRAPTEWYRSSPNSYKVEVGGVEAWSGVAPHQ